MARFIECVYMQYNYTCNNLKSNMDRFIGGKKIFFYGDLKYLKSNMDRFIVKGVLKYDKR